MNLIMYLIEKRLIPDILVRFGIRYLVAQRLREETNEFLKNENKLKDRFVSKMIDSPIAINTVDANTQHYELPSEFFNLVLGEHNKYSGCVWEKGIKTLTEAEASSLKIYCERAKILDGMNVLELGCGWGSLSLWIATHYPNTYVTAVSNSKIQRQFILNIRDKRGLNNLNIITADMNTFQPNEQFDRVVSIEMFEHMRNYKILLNRIKSWLNPEGKLFIHIFCHRKYPYFFENEGHHNWMGRYFFTGGVMPSSDLFTYFQNDLSLENQWWWDGKHYQKTAEAWLNQMDHKKEEIYPLLKTVYGNKNADCWFQRWRIFFMSCSELFGYKKGNEWGVSHYLFSQK
jgi:cyclopropane-fatty-acyl-phospholipid synthase